MKVGLIYDPVFLEHDTGSHPENKQRLIETIGLLEKSGLKDQLVSLLPRMANDSELLTIHSPEHISAVESASAKGGAWLDGDTFASPGSFKAALYAVGGLLRGVDEVLSGELVNIHPSAKIVGPTMIGSNCSIGPEVHIKGPVVIGTDCHIGEGTTMEETVLWNGVNIGKGAALRRCIVSSHTTVSNNVQVVDRALAGDHIRIIENEKQRG